MIDAVSVGRDVLIRDGKDLGQLANRILIDIQQILADLQDVAFLDGGGDRKAAGIDDVVSLGRVAGHQSIDLLCACERFALDLIAERFGVHQGHRIVGTGRCAGADMRCQIDVAFETVALVLHVQQLGRDRQRHQSAIAVRNIADCTGTGANAAEPAHEADRGSGTTHAASVCTGDKHADDIGRALGGVDVNDLDICVCTDAL